MKEVLLLLNPRLTKAWDQLANGQAIEVQVPNQRSRFQFPRVQDQDDRLKFPFHLNVRTCVHMSDLMNATLLGTPGVVGVYNHNMPCEYFRNDTSRLLFKVWPEASFKYCCEDSTPHLYSLQNFTYGDHGARIISRPYFDLGNVDDLSPYWTQYKFWQVPQTQIVLEGLQCEYTDLAKLYSHRFWNHVVKEGVITALWIILLLQLIVVVFVVFNWVFLLWHNRNEQHRRTLMWKRFRASLKRWWWTKIKLEDWVSDLTHLALLVIGGTALIEAVGHSSPITWRPILFYNAAVVYAWLTLLSLVSSVLRQLAVSSFDENEDQVKFREYVLLDLEEQYFSKDLPVPKEKLKEIQTTNLALSRISEDWRWQRVFGQLAVLILVGTYLLFVDDASGTAMDSVAAIVFATVVVACMWSGGVGLVVVGRTVAHIWRHFLAEKLKFAEDPESAKVLEKIRLEESKNVVSGSQRLSQRFQSSGSHQFSHPLYGISEEMGSEGFRRL